MKRGGATTPRPAPGTPEHDDQIRARVEKRFLNISRWREHSGSLLRGLPRIMDEAREKRISLSAALERIDPSTDFDYQDMPLDAFERVLKAAGIRQTSVPGKPASSFGVFMRDDDLAGSGAILANELVSRIYKAAILRREMPRYTHDERLLSRISFSSDDLPSGSVLRPYFDQAQLRMAQIAPAIPLDQLIAMTTETTQMVARAPYLTEPTAAQIRMVRVGEAAEIPRTKIGTRQQVSFLHKYGRALEISYEAMRQTPIDMVALLLSRVAIQAELDKVATVIDVIVNGDGNAGTAATVVDLTDLDTSTTANNLTLTAWLNFLLQFPNPYTLTTGLANNNVILKIMTLNVGTANTLLAQVNGLLGVGTVRPLNPEFAGAVALGATTDAPANKLIGIDRRFAVQRFIETGSEINETARWIQRQVQFLTITESEGYGIIDPNASRVLNLAA